MTQVSPGARVARGATYMFASGFAVSLIGLFYIVFLTRTLSKDDMGIYAILNLFIAAAQTFGTLALTSAAVKYIAQYLAEKHPDKARSVASAVLKACLVASILFSSVLFILAERLSLWLFGIPSYAWLFQMLAIVAFLNVLYLGAASFLQGLQRMFEVSLISLVLAGLQSFFGVYFIIMGWGLMGIVYGWLIGGFVSALISLTLVRRFLGISRKSHPTKPLFDFSSPLYLSNILTFFVSWIDLIFVYGLLAEGITGTYYIAVRASIVPSLMFTSIITALFPQLTELYARNGAKSLKTAFHLSTRYATLLGFPIIIGIATLAYPIIILFAGWEYVEAAFPLIILCISTLPATLGVAINAILMTTERTKIASAITIISLFSEVAALYIFLAYLKLGTPGAALSKVISAFIGFALGILALRKNPGLSFDKDALLKGSASCAIMVFAIILLDVVRQYFAASQQFLNFHIYLLPIYVTVGAAAYFLSLVALRAIKKQDIELAREYLPNSLKPIAKWLGRIARVE
jgi:O-antigen/teichoic acid export membrane protein